MIAVYVYRGGECILLDAEGGLPPLRRRFAGGISFSSSVSVGVAPGLFSSSGRVSISGSESRMLHVASRSRNRDAMVFTNTGEPWSGALGKAYPPKGPVLSLLLPSRSFTENEHGCCGFVAVMTRHMLLYRNGGHRNSLQYFVLILYTKFQSTPKLNSELRSTVNHVCVAFARSTTL